VKKQTSCRQWYRELKQNQEKRERDNCRKGLAPRSKSTVPRVRFVSYGKKTIGHKGEEERINTSTVKNTRFSVCRRNRCEGTRKGNLETEKNATKLKWVNSRKKGTKGGKGFTIAISF